MNFVATKAGGSGEERRGLPAARVGMEAVRRGIKRQGVLNRILALGCFSCHGCADPCSGGKKLLCARLSTRAWRDEEEKKALVACGIPALWEAVSRGERLEVSDDEICGTRAKLGEGGE